MDNLIDQNIIHANAQMKKMEFGTKCTYTAAAATLLTIPAFMVQLNEYSMILRVYLGSILFGKAANHFETTIDTRQSSTVSLQKRIDDMKAHKDMMAYKEREDLLRKPGDPIMLDGREQRYLSRHRVSKREMRYEATRTKRSDQHQKNMIDLFGYTSDEHGAHSMPHNRL